MAPYGFEANELILPCCDIAQRVATLARITPSYMSNDSDVEDYFVTYALSTKKQVQVRPLILLNFILHHHQTCSFTIKKLLGLTLDRYYIVCHY